MVKILVPTDYSKCSIAALKHAVFLARGSGAMLLVLHVVVPDSPYLAPGTGDEKDPLEQDATLLLQTLAQGEPAIQFEERRVIGAPVHTIISVALQENADLIVMGTAGRTGIRRIMLGSVAEEVVRQAPCPVLTLRAKYSDDDDLTSDEMWDKWTQSEHRLVIPTSHSNDAFRDRNNSPTLALISRAIAARASDIHIDPMGNEYSVRFRIDGQLHNYCRLSIEVGRALLTQLKVTGNLDIADPFHSKEGRLQLPESMHDFEARITVVPVLDGEAVSVRVLNRNRLLRPLDELGMSSDCIRRIQEILAKGEGLVLVTGPTGSGKTTTLYSMLHALDDGTRNVVSIEDPVEYNIPTFRQLPVDLKHGATMNTGLRTLLRLDPDVVLIGEIRDVEAAETAMRAASSGKHVFSSLHTRDVASTVTALRDLRIDNRSLAGNLIGIVSQRLVRRLCSECSRLAVITDAEAAVFRHAGMEAPSQIRHAVGCPHCHGTGYYDRIGLFEVVAPGDDIVQVIENGEPEDAVRAAIRSRGIANLQSEALKNVAMGITSLDDSCRTIWH